MRRYPPIKVVVDSHSVPHAHAHSLVVRIGALVSTVEAMETMVVGVDVANLVEAVAANYLHRARAHHSHSHHNIHSMR